jgi:VIT1/CCC1 family predicted Fe2+/Mn2+ transporter
MQGWRLLANCGRAGGRCERTRPDTVKAALESSRLDAREARAEHIRELRRNHEPRFGPDMMRHYLGDLIYGANDGLVTTFAVVSGVTGAALSPRTALILGLANLFADGFSMGASNFLAIRTVEAGRTAGQDPVEPFPARHGVATALAFVSAGSVPLLAYAAAPPGIRFTVAVCATLTVMFIAGSLRATVTSLQWWRAGLEMLAVGSAASAVAYAVGALLRGLGAM